MSSARIDLEFELALKYILDRLRPNVGCGLETENSADQNFNIDIDVEVENERTDTSNFRLKYIATCNVFSWYPMKLFSTQEPLDKRMSQKKRRKRFTWK